MDFKPNVFLKDFTTLKIGGPAKFFTSVQTTGDFISALKFAQDQKIPYLIIGGGSNLLISDEGFPGLVIKNDLQGIRQEGPTVIVQSGTLLQNLVNFTIENQLGYIHKLTGIPGTTGGAVYGNAGAYGQTISQYIKQVVCLNPQSGEKVTLPKDDCQFDYRNSIFKKNGFTILEIHFQFEPLDKTILLPEAREILAQRILKYPPTLKCPGSFFKNIPVEKISAEGLKLIPRDKITFDKVPVGYLLESVGAKGEKCGSIQISPNHGNLFINLGEGTAADFRELAEKLARKVKEKYGIDLEPEVQLINLPKFNL